MRRDCDRAFLRLDAGLLHYRHAGTRAGAVSGSPSDRPVWMMHASPASSRSLEPLAIALAKDHGLRVIAPDTPGNGDSAALGAVEPELCDYADAFVHAMDMLGIECADLYGFHTGAHIAIELAIGHPDRVGSVVLDGLLWLEEHERDEYLRLYAPPLTPDAHGTQVFAALNFIRDQAWFFPHFRRDAAHNLGAGAMPPELLHVLTVELLKAATTYHLPYRAVFRHALAQRLPKLAGHRVMMMADATDPTRDAVLRAAALVPAARSAVGGEGWSESGMAAKAATIAGFLRGSVRGQG